MQTKNWSQSRHRLRWIIQKETVSSKVLPIHGSLKRKRGVGDWNKCSRLPRPNPSLALQASMT